MKIPKFFQPVLGVLTALILFFIGMLVLSTVFVAAVEAFDYAKDFTLDILDSITIPEWFYLY
ncbi:MAG: hypothetical protein HDR88_18585 [Bacteroides sp.]|nr:hypothetical protein [Bacteroides sp.]